MPRILVIEDEIPLCDEIASNLTFEGFEVYTANDGQTGINIALTSNIDLILCDIMMPNVTGYEVLSALRERPQTATIPFIFITARAGQAAVRMGMALGADDYLAKPFSQTELLDAIHARLARMNEIQIATNSSLTHIKQQALNQLYHELRSPLTVISLAHGVLDMGLETFSHNEIHDLLNRMNSGINRLDNLIEQVTLRARIDMGDLTQDYIHKRSIQIELYSLITSTIHMSRSIAYRNQNVVIDVQKFDEWIMVRGIATLLKLAISECITTTINTSPAGKFISICQWVLDGYASVSIAVQRVGVKQNLPTINVEPFNPMPNDVDEEIGLGMPVAKALIEMHGGTISADTNNDQGNLIIIRLPISAKTGNLKQETMVDAK